MLLRFKTLGELEICPGGRDHVHAGWVDEMEDWLGAIVPRTHMHRAINVYNNFMNNKNFRRLDLGQTSIIIDGIYYSGDMFTLVSDKFFKHKLALKNV